MPAPNAVNAHVQHPASRAIPTGELKKSVINAASDNCENHPVFNPNALIPARTKGISILFHA